jgi:carboxylesterase type B
MQCNAIAMSHHSVFLLLFFVLLYFMYVAQRHVTPFRVAPKRTVTTINVQCQHCSTACWRGIAYARPPVGALRWRAPVADDTHVLKQLPPSPGVYSAVCPQDGKASYDNVRTTKMSEDCLYLNVFAPAAAPALKAKRKVMVWIHGGSFTSGAASIPLFTGAPIVAQSPVRSATPRD